MSRNFKTQSCHSWYGIKQIKSIFAHKGSSGIKFWAPQVAFGYLKYFSILKTNLERYLFKRFTASQNRHLFRQHGRHGIHHILSLWTRVSPCTKSPGLTIQDNDGFTVIDIVIL